MSWTNYHTHSLFCDGKACPEDFVVAYLAKGFIACGFSSHAPVPFPSRWNMDFSKLDPYLDEIRSLQRLYEGRIEIYAGVEMDYIENFWGFRESGLPERKLDYVIGSVHYLGRLPDGSFFCFDGQPEAFFRGIELVFGNNFRNAIMSYYSSVRSMIEREKPDVVGHLDKIKMHNSVKPYFSEEDPWYRAQVEETLDLIARSGCILEVNTRGYYKHNPPMLYPGEWVIDRAFSLQIPVTLSSDAHQPDEIESGFAYATGILKKAGYTKIRVFLNGKWQDRTFNETGILV